MDERTQIVKWLRDEAREWSGAGETLVSMAANTFASKIERGEHLPTEAD